MVCEEGREKEWKKSSNRIYSNGFKLNNCNYRLFGNLNSQYHATQYLLGEWKKIMFNCNNIITIIANSFKPSHKHKKIVEKRIIRSKCTTVSFLRIISLLWHFKRLWQLHYSHYRAYGKWRIWKLFSFSLTDCCCFECFSIKCFTAGGITLMTLFFLVGGKKKLLFILWWCRCL